MDVLTSAASAHEAAETHSSGGASKISSEAQILALKRKLIECDQESREQRERIAGLEKALEIEKREHQLTTSKLTMLLNKRRASDAQCATTAHTHQSRHRSHAPEPPPLTRTRAATAHTHQSRHRSHAPGACPRAHAPGACPRLDAVCASH